MNITKEMAAVATEFRKYEAWIERDAALLQEIVRLRAELAGDAEYLEGYKEGMLENIAELAEQLKQTRHKLAASQAREKLLRIIPIATHRDQIMGALCGPTDDTALREMLARAQEEMRERCVTEIKELTKATRLSGEGATNGMYEHAACVLEDAEAAIRALEVKP